LAKGKSTFVERGIQLARPAAVAITGHNVG
jgi:hypothetical protein